MTQRPLNDWQLRFCAAGAFRWHSKDDETLTAEQVRQAVDEIRTRLDDELANQLAPLVCKSQTLDFMMSQVDDFIARRAPAGGGATCSRCERACTIVDAAGRCERCRRVEDDGRSIR